jgi:hypothetical protein
MPWAVESGGLATIWVPDIKMGSGGSATSSVPDKKWALEDQLPFQFLTCFRFVPVIWLSWRHSCCCERVFSWWISILHHATHASFWMHCLCIPESCQELILQCSENMSGSLKNTRIGSKAHEPLTLGKMIILFIKLHVASPDYPLELDESPIVY